MTYQDNQNQPDRIVYPIDEPNGDSLITHKGKLTIAFAVFLLSVTYLGFTAFQSASSYYLTVGEVLEKGESIYGKNLRVNGKLVHDSFQRESIGATMSFAITDGEETIDAVYKGLVPDLFFNEHSEIMLEGTYTSGGPFDTHSIIVKCPSKYEAVDESVKQSV